MIRDYKHCHWDKPNGNGSDRAKAFIVTCAWIWVVTVMAVTLVGG